MRAILRGAEDHEMHIDVTAKPVGSFFGGKQGLSVECTHCKRPALKLPGQVFAHGFELKLNAFNDPECVWDLPCSKARYLQHLASLAVGAIRPKQSTG